MLKKIGISLGILITAMVLWFINFNEPNTYIENIFKSLVVVFILYLIFKLGLEELITTGIKDSKTKYSLRKTVSIMFIIFVLLGILSIWIQNPDALYVAFGLIGAGIAIALQDVFKNFAGGIIIFVNSIYRVGDRIEVNSRIGDVIDIHILYTTILELQGWVSAEQPTGRLTIIPNGTVLSNAVNNYSRDHNFIWDEITLPLTYDTDWKKALPKFKKIVKQVTAKMEVQAEKDIAKLEEKYFLTKRIIEPNIFIKLTDNWLEVYIRYVVELRQRRFVKDKISRLILKEIEKSDNIKLASATVDIVGFPEVRIRQHDNEKQKVRPEESTR